MPERRQTDDAELRQQVAELSQFVMRLAGASVVENVLVNGFATLSAQLEPLRDLAPQRTHMKEDEYKRLQILRHSLARPEWTGAGSLSVKEEHVPFIGEVVYPIPIPDRTYGSAES